MAPKKQKPPVSEWIVRERKRLAWKPIDVSRRLLEAGYDAQVSTVQVWESGRSPKAETITALEKLFGSQAPKSETENSADIAAALRELVEEVRLSRLASERQAGTLAELIGLVAAGGPPQLESGAEGGAQAHQGRR